MSDWRKHEDRASGTPLTKIDINGVERTTLARRLAYEDVVAGAGFLERMKKGECFLVVFTEPSDGAGGTRVGKLTPGESVEVVDPFGRVTFTVEEMPGEQVQSNGSARR